METLTPAELEELVAVAVKCCHDLYASHEIAVGALRDVENALTEHKIEGASFNHEWSLGEQARHLADYIEKNGDGSCFEFEDVIRDVDDLGELAAFVANNARARRPLEEAEAEAVEEERLRRAGREAAEIMNAKGVREALDAMGPTLGELEGMAKVLERALHGETKPKLEVVAGEEQKPEEEPLNAS